MSCPDTQQLGAWFDGELEPQEAQRVAAHLEGCADCREALSAFAGMRAELRSSAPTAPTALRERVLAAVAREAETTAAAAPVGPRPGPARKARTPGLLGRFWLGAATGAGAAGLLGAATLLSVGHWTRHGTLEQLAQDHVRALSAGPLIEVASTDRHTVKPWFAGRSDVSPPVADFAAAGYVLVGGRTARLAGQRAAVTVYRHGPHLIEVYSWQVAGALPAGDASSDEVLRRGFRIRCWRQGDLRSCAISDAGREEIARLETLLQGISTP